MNTLERIITEVRNSCTGVLDNVIKFELFNVLDEFFKTTNAWQEDIVVTTRGNSTSYEIESDQSRASIIRILYAKDANGGPVNAVLANNLTELWISRSYEAPTRITVRVALTVLDPTSTDSLPYVPDGIFAKYRELIVDGLLYRLMAQPNKPYSDARLALLRGRSFRSGINRAKGEIERGFLYAGQLWRFPQSFATVR